MSELVEQVREGIMAAWKRRSRTDHLDEDMARAAIEAVFAWLAEPSKAAASAGYGALTTDFPCECDEAKVWSVMLAVRKKEALG